MEALILSNGSPADPTVSVFAFKGGSLPAQQGEPMPLKYSPIAKSFTDKGVKAEIMVLTDESIPEIALT